VNPRPLGVGILGAGPVVQAIHLPTLARLPDLFTVRHLMDVKPEVTASVAGRVGARWSSSVEELLADEDVDVVAVCSPHQFHADQVIAAMRAGKKAVLCEKPFAQTREEASAIAAVSAETGVPVIVGAMHTFDPGWLAASAAWGDLPRTAHTVRSRIVIPPNARFEDWATEVVARLEPPAPDGSDPEVRVAMLRGAVMGLAIHDLPLVRQFLPGFSTIQVDYADVYLPFGYVLGMSAESRMVHLSGHVTTQWEPSWTFEAFDDSTHLLVTFTPSYVHAGSATATITRGGVATTFGPYDHNGYEGEWRVLHDVVHGDRAHLPKLDDLVDDLTFAIDIADAATDLTTGVRA
jgi:myo-inositol 2-dehydrogenase/D-chiro-inositol 1-dehydrogenase